jgi:nucleoside-diphosphate-sugar epimerase
MVKTVLITGGLGNLGSWLTHHFCEKGFEVTVLTKRLRKMEFHAPFHTLVCDISSIEDCKAKISKPYDLVIHCASMNENLNEHFSQDALMVNSLGTRNLLEVLKVKPPKHFIYFSTFHVYGKNSGTITEETDTVPLNDYGITHLFAEYYVKQYHTLHQIPYSIIRLSNSYGCPKDYESSKWYLILNDLSKMAFEEQKIVLKGNGLASRDFIWMGDVCQITEYLAIQSARNETFNVSSEQSYSLKTIAEAVQKAYLKYKGMDINIELNQNDNYKPGETMLIQSKKIKKRVNYNALPHFEEEARKIFEFLSNK